MLDDVTSKLHCPANLKLPAADCHVHTKAGKEDRRDIGFEVGYSDNPDEDVIDELVGEGESTDDLVGLATTNIRTGVTALRSTKEAVAPPHRPL